MHIFETTPEIRFSAAWRPISLMWLIIVWAIFLAFSALSVCAAQEIKGTDDAKKDFGRVSFPSAQPTRSYSASPSCGCLAGAVGLTVNGKYWQIMRLQRNRRWGHPNLLAYLESLGNRAHEHGWNGLLIGDMSQPRGGPMVNGHASHQAGFDVDIWLDEMPMRILSAEERNKTMVATSLLKPGTNELNGKFWNDKRALFIKDAATDPAVARIFVAPAIKRALCKCKDPNGADTIWLRRLRPWWGHDDHIHVRLHCPDIKTCFEQELPPEGDGCDAEVDEWLAKTAININGSDNSSSDSRSKCRKVNNMPAPCLQVLQAQDKR